VNLLLRPRMPIGQGEPLLKDIWTWLPEVSEDDDDIVALIVAIHGRRGRLEKQ